MKSLALTFASLLITSSAFAATGLVANLSQVMVNGHETPYRGVVRVNAEESQISLDIYNDPCEQMAPRDGRIRCMMAPMRIQSLQVPALPNPGDCGTMIYSGHVDTESGAAVDIKVVDNTNRVCLDIVPSRIIVRAEVVDPVSNGSTTFELKK